MPKKSTTPAEVGKKAVKRSSSPRSLSVALGGIQTGSDFAKLMSALMTDLIAGDVTPAIGNATCNAGGKLLKVVEMQMRYGTPNPGGTVRVLELTSGGSSDKSE